MSTTVSVIVENDGNGEPCIWLTTGPDDPAAFPLLLRSELVTQHPPAGTPGYELKVARRAASEQLWDAIVGAIQDTADAWPAEVAS